MRHPRLRDLTVVALATRMLAARAQVPDHGRVVEAKERGQAVQTQLQYFNPKGPQPGQSPADIVTGYLVAMTATPLTTRTAQKFLSREARAQWRPQRVVTYSNLWLPRGTHHVVVRL